MRISLNTGIYQNNLQNISPKKRTLMMLAILMADKQIKPVKMKKTNITKYYLARKIYLCLCIQTTMKQKIVLLKNLAQNYYMPKSIIETILKVFFYLVHFKKQFKLPRPSQNRSKSSIIDLKHFQKSRTRLNGYVNTIHSKKIEGNN